MPLVQLFLTHPPHPLTIFKPSYPVLNEEDQNLEGRATPSQVRDRDRSPSFMQPVAIRVKCVLPTVSFAVRAVNKETESPLSPSQLSDRVRQETIRMF